VKEGEKERNKETKGRKEERKERKNPEGQRYWA
jgi:hypothetical protein